MTMTERVYGAFANRIGVKPPTIRCAAGGKGFGKTQQSSNPKVTYDNTVEFRGNGDKTVREALKLVDRYDASNPQATNSSQQGRVDYVKVSSWGNGNTAELGNLPIATHTQRAPDDAPFYEILARHMEALQAGGALAVAPTPNAALLPPFSRWSFAEAHYVQYLLDMRIVHQAIEEAHETAMTTFTSGGSTWEGHRDSHTLSAAFAVLHPVVAGLGRSHAMSADLENMATARSATEKTSSSIIPTEPSPNAVAIAAALKRAALQCQRAESHEELYRAAARVFASSYVFTLTLLTGGNRVGAAAAEKLKLFARQAVHTYRTYPDGLERPLAAFRVAVDEAGRELGAEGRVRVMEEVGPALRKASTLLEAIARE